MTLGYELPKLGLTKFHMSITLLSEGLEPSSFHQNVYFDQTNIFYSMADDVRLHLISIISELCIINELNSTIDNSASRPLTGSIQKPMNTFL